VSESQKEFVDLAFRMALFDAVRQPTDGVMLVMKRRKRASTSIIRERPAICSQICEDGTGEPNVIIVRVI